MLRKKSWSRTGTASEITGTKDAITSIGIGTRWDVNNELFALCEAGIARIAESVGNHVGNRVGNRVGNHVGNVSEDIELRIVARGDEKSAPNALRADFLRKISALGLLDQ